jgi:DNA-binding transcriptional LysR family regulator
VTKRSLGDLRLVWIDAFVLVSELGTFAAVAQALNTDPSIVSRYMRNLEYWLLKTLVKRGSNGQLTEEGEAFLPVAIQVQQLFTQSRATPVPPSRKVSGTIIDMSALMPKGESSADTD